MKKQDYHFFPLTLMMIYVVSTAYAYTKYSIMKKMIYSTLLLVANLFLSLAISVSSLHAQVLIDPTGDGGFENGTTFSDNGWTVANGSVTNKWYLGSVPTGFSGRAAYISNDGGTSHTYSNSPNSNISVVHFYRDITFPAGVQAFTLSFQWKAGGEQFFPFDAIIVSLAPTFYTPFVSNETLYTGTLPPPANMLEEGPAAPQLWGQFNVQTATYSIKSSVLGNCSAPATWRLIFTWKNDGNVGQNPPGAIDNISLEGVPPPSSAPIPGTSMPGTPTAPMPGLSTTPVFTPTLP